MMMGRIDLTKRPGGGAIDIDVLKRKSWPGISAQFIRIAAPTAYNFKVANSATYIGVHDLYRIDGETIASGVVPSYAKDLRNKLTYAPAGCDLEGWCKIDKPGSLSMVVLEPSASGRSSVDPTQHPPRIEFEDHMLRSLMLRFQAVLEDPSLDLPGYVETLGELLLFELDRISSRQPRAPGQPCGLTSRQVRLVTEYMESHLTDKTTVSELATLVDLTRFHFIRSFKRTTGVPPHRFMIQRRIDRAKELLAQSDKSIAEVAAGTGFRNSIDLARAFRRIVGTTPSAFRRDQA
jgi:AraC family transcriptional regulator